MSPSGAPRNDNGCSGKSDHGAIWQGTHNVCVQHTGVGPVGFIYQNQYLVRMIPDGEQYRFCGELIICFLFAGRSRRFPKRVSWNFIILCNGCLILVFLNRCKDNIGAILLHVPGKIVLIVSPINCFTRQTGSAS